MMVLATESDVLNLQAETDICVVDYLNEETGGSEAEEPLYTDYSVTELTVTEAGSYWLTGYDAINKKAEVAKLQGCGRRGMHRGCGAGGQCQE